MGLGAEVDRYVFKRVTGGILMVMGHLGRCGGYIDLLVIKCIELICAHARTHVSTGKTKDSE